MRQGRFSQGSRSSRFSVHSCTHFLIKHWHAYDGGHMGLGYSQHTASTIFEKSLSPQNCSPWNLKKPVIHLWCFSLHLLSLLCSAFPSPSLHLKDSFFGGKGFAMCLHFIMCQELSQKEIHAQVTEVCWVAALEGLHLHWDTLDSSRGKSNLLPASGKCGCQGIMTRSFLIDFPLKGNKLEEIQRCSRMLFWLKPEPRAVITLDFPGKFNKTDSILLLQNVCQFHLR